MRKTLSAFTAAAALVTGIAAAGPAAASQKAASRSSATTRATVYTAHIKFQKQPNNYTCVPTSASMSLYSILGTRAPSEATLAKQMDTTTAGTYWNTERPVLDRYAAPKGLEYVAVQTSSTSNLKNDLIADLSKGHAPTLPVWAGLLKWDTDLYDGKQNYGHAVVVDQVTSDGYVWIVDPWTGTAHKETVAQLYTQLQNHTVFEIESTARVQANATPSSAAKQMAIDVTRPALR